LTIEEEKYYENYFDMFNSEGWKQLMEEIVELSESYSIEHLNTLEELHKAKGEKEVLLRLSNFQTGIEASYASLNEDNSEL
jgi:hypothetical protein